MLVKSLLDTGVRREHLDVGLDEMCGALLMFVGLTLERAVCLTKTESLRRVVGLAKAAELGVDSELFMRQIIWAGLCIFALFLLLILVTLLKRNYGTDPNGRPTWFFGIILPDLVAYASLGGVAMYFSNACQ